MSTTTDNPIEQLGLASYEMSVSINRAQRAFSELLKTCLGHHGLTPPEWSLLGKLYSTNSLRPTEISNFLGVKPPYVAKLLVGLTRQGYVCQHPVPDDDRGKTLRLTDAGRALVTNVEQKLEICLNNQLGSLAPADLQVYFQLTEYIAANVHHH